LTFYPEQEEDNLKCFFVSPPLFEEGLVFFSFKAVKIPAKLTRNLEKRL